VTDMIDGHVHLERGGYTRPWLNEFIKYALERDITEIYFLEHSHRFIEFEHMYDSVINYSEYQRAWLSRKLCTTIDNYTTFIDDMRRQDFPIKIKFGLEVCYIEGTEAIVSDIKNRFNFDFVTGSIHFVDGFGFDHKKEFWQGKDINQVYRQYYDNMKSLIKSDLFDTVAHPDSIKCFGHNSSEDLSDTYNEIANLLNEHNMCAEMSAGLKINYGFAELGMNKKMLDIFKKKNVKLYTVSDAHKPEDVGRYIKETEMELL
jgi:histidinol-phosphatase (PHP family)